MADVAHDSVGVARARVRDLPDRWFLVGVLAVAVAATIAIAAILSTWPPHEDETLALFVGRSSLPHLFDVVVAQRGGAPLHFLLAWIVAHLGGGLIALRALSLLFAVASLPLVALLGARLADRTVGLVASALAGASWVFLFHAVYGRMYSLFLFTSLLSFLALLDALEQGGRRRFALWGLAVLALLASHPYGVLVLVAQAVYVLLRHERLRAALWTLVAVLVAAAPFWWADLVLRGRFGVGVGGGGSTLGSPRAVAHYFWWVAGDFSAGHHGWSTPVLLVAAVGLLVLTWRRPHAALLCACVALVPAAAFSLARLHASASPEARHLIFALPFFSVLVATAIVEAARLRPPLTPVLALVAVAALVYGEAAWAQRKTPPLFKGDPPAEARARAAAADWLAATSRPDDVLLGYEPVYLLAWQRERAFSRHALPRADPVLLAKALRALPEPLGRGVWVFDASDTTNVVERQTIPLRFPRPRSAFEARVFGPYLVIRSRRPLGSRSDYVAVSERVMTVGKKLGIGDADINLHSLLLAETRL